jgi:Xaa-Pro aminopeptidase
MEKARSRIRYLQRKLEAEHLDCALFTVGASMQYLLNDQTLKYHRTGYSKMSQGAGYFSGLSLPTQLLVVPAQGTAFILCHPQNEESSFHYGLNVYASFWSHYPYYWRKHCKGKRIAIGADAYLGLKDLFLHFDTTLEIIPGESLCDDIRLIKDTDEINTLRKAAALTDAVMEATIPLLIEGSRPMDVEAFIQEEGRRGGATDVSFPAACIYTRPGHVSAQERIGYPKDLPLLGNTGIAFDFGFVLDGYCSDYGRSFYRGQPPIEIEKAYEALQNGQQEMVKQLKPGIHRVSDIDRFIREVVTAQGFGSRMLYADTGICGHQIGIDVHEDPWLLNSETTILQPGMVFCAEPKIWFPGECYMRVEDMILITETGAEFLTNFSRKLYQLT